MSCTGLFGSIKQSNSSLVFIVIADFYALPSIGFLRQLSTALAEAGPPFNGRPADAAYDRLAATSYCQIARSRFAVWAEITTGGIRMALLIGTFMKSA